MRNVISLDRVNLMHCAGNRGAQVKPTAAKRRQGRPQTETGERRQAFQPDDGWRASPTGTRPKASPAQSSSFRVFRVFRGKNIHQIKPDHRNNWCESADGTPSRLRPATSVWQVSVPFAVWIYESTAHHCCLIEFPVTCAADARSRVTARSAGKSSPAGRSPPSSRRSKRMLTGCRFYEPF